MRLKTPHSLLLSALLCLASVGVPSARAQQPAPPPPPPDMLSWMPAGLLALEQQSATHTDFTFDRNMLALAGNLAGLDAPTRAAVARLNGITVHLLRFSSVAGYSSAAVQAIRDQYDALGWHHLVSTGARPSAPDQVPGRTDVWLDTHGVDVAGAAIVFAGIDNVDVVVVSGDLSTLDLLHLRGHFGIPRFPEQSLQTP